MTKPGITLVLLTALAVAAAIGAPAETETTAGGASILPAPAGQAAEVTSGALPAPRLRVGSEWSGRLGETGIYPSDLFVFESTPKIGDEEKKSLDARRRYFMGQYYLEMNEPAHALGEFRGALESDASNTMVMLAIADARIQSRDFDGARQQLEEVLKSDPKNVQALLLKAKIHMTISEAATGAIRSEGVRKSIDTFNEARRIEPKNLEALKGIAAAYFVQQDVDKIIQAYRDIVDVNPKDTHAMLVLANILAKTGHEQEALTLFEKIVEQRRAFINGYIYLGQLYDKLGRENDAIETFKKALLIEPRNEHLLKGFDLLLGKAARGKPQGFALSQYQQFAKEYPYSSEIQRLYADQLLAAKDYNAALAQYKRVLELDGENLEAIIASGNIHLERRNYDEATKYFSKAVDINPDKVEVYDAIAMSFVGQKEPVKAVEMYRKAIKLNPKIDRLYLSLASVYDQSGKPQDAIQALKDGIAALGDKSEFLAVMGQIYEKAGDNDQALANYEKALLLSPQNPPLLARALSQYIRHGQQDKIDALLARLLTDFKDKKADLFTLIGDAYQAEGQPDKAMEYYEKAMQEKPQKLIVTQRLVTLYNNKKDYDKSLKMLDAARTNFRDNEDIPRMICETLMQKKEYDKAVETARGIVDARPNSINSYRILVDALNKTGRHSDALAAVAIAEDKLGKSEDTDLLRGISLYQQKRYDLAEKMFKELLARKSRNSDIYYYFLGSICLDQKRYDAAEKAFRKSLESNPNNDNSLNALGYMFADTGVKLDEAKDLVTRALEMNPGAPHILDSMGWVMFKMGKLDDARDYIEKAAKLMGEDAEIFEHLGDIHAAKGDVNMALDFWRRSLAIDQNRAGLRDKISAKEK